MEDKREFSEEDKKEIEKALKMAKDLLWEQTQLNIRAQLIGKIVAKIEWLKQKD